MIDNGVLVVQGGKIAWAGPASGVEIDEDVKVVDLGRVWLVPGFLVPHNHVAGSLGDLNDNVYLTNPEFRTVDLLEPRNPNLLDAVAGGVTTALLIPGSGSNMGGFGMVVKTTAESIDDMIVRSARLAEGRAVRQPGALLLGCAPRDDELEHAQHAA